MNNPLEPPGPPVRAVAAILAALTVLVLWRAADPPPPSSTTTTTTSRPTVALDDDVERGRPLAATRGRPLDPAPPPATTTTAGPTNDPTTTTAPRVIPPTTTTASTPPSTTSTTATPPTSSPPSNGAGEYLGAFLVTCYGPPQFPAGQHTASGEPVGAGSIAADPRVVPLGWRLRLDGVDLGTDDGTGHVNDTGGAVHGHHLDVWLADCTTRGWDNPTVDVWRLP